MQRANKLATYTLKVNPASSVPVGKYTISVTATGTTYSCKGTTVTDYFELNVVAPPPTPSIVSTTNRLWYFFGEPSPNTDYPTATTLYANYAGQASSYTWKIVSGGNRVALGCPTCTNQEYTGTNSITIFTKKGSAYPDDVNVTVTANGRTSPPYYATVAVPYKSIYTLTNDYNDLDKPSGFRSLVCYYDFDQFGVNIISKYPRNENFFSEIVKVYSDAVGPTNWRNNEPNGGNPDGLGPAASDPSRWCDTLALQPPDPQNYRPIPLRPFANSYDTTGGIFGIFSYFQRFQNQFHNRRVKVFYFTGAWYVGSRYAGKGWPIMFNNWNLYQAAGDHSYQESPFAKIEDIRS